MSANRYVYQSIASVSGSAKNLRLNNVHYRYKLLFRGIKDLDCPGVSVYLADVHAELLSS